MPIDPDLAAILVAFLLAALLGAVGSARTARARRRAAAFCASCGRRFVQRLPTCDCDLL